MSRTSLLLKEKFLLKFKIKNLIAVNFGGERGRFRTGQANAFLVKPDASLILQIIEGHRYMIK